MTDKMAEYIDSLPPLCHTLPYVFTETGGKIENLSIKCSNCGKEILASEIRGRFESFNEHSVSLTAFGLCFDDKTVTPMEVRFASDGSLLTKSPTGWVRGRWGQEQSVSWFRKLITFFGENK